MQKPKAFVLMPFDEDFDSVYFKLIEPTLQTAGYDVSRADQSMNQQQILKDIVTALAHADLVIADVTGLNGNVMYELGLAHAMGRRTMMITQDIAELPFDLRSYRANAYSTNFDEAPKLQELIASVAGAVQDGSAEFSNPVQDFAPDFLGRPEQVADPPSAPNTEPATSSKADTTSAKQSPELEEERLRDTEDAEEDKGLLDFTIDLSSSSEDIVDLGGQIGSATEQIGLKLTDRTREIGETSERLGTSAAPALRGLMREVAKDFVDYSDILTALNPQLRAALTRMGESANGLARSRPSQTRDERQQLASEIASLRSAEASFETAYENITGFAATLSGMPKMEQTLSRSLKHTVRVVNETATIIDLGRSEFARARGIMEERLTRTIVSDGPQVESSSVVVQTGENLP